MFGNQNPLVDDFFMSMESCLIFLHVIFLLFFLLIYRKYFVVEHACDDGDSSLDDEHE